MIYDVGHVMVVSCNRHDIISGSHRSDGLGLGIVSSPCYFHAIRVVARQLAAFVRKRRADSKANIAMPEAQRDITDSSVQFQLLKH